MPHGYNGSILHVDLGKRSFEVEKPSDVWYRTYFSRIRSLHLLFS